MAEKEVSAKPVVNVQQLLDTISTSSSKLAARIREADLDNDGSLSMEELVEVIRSEQQAIGDRKLLRYILIALAVAVLVLIATLCGTVYAVVKLTQEVNDQDGVLVSASSGAVMSTGLVQERVAGVELYRYRDPAMLRGIESVVLPSPEGDTMYRVSKIATVRNMSATVYTLGGTTLQVDDSGVYVVNETDSPSAPGRRSLSQIQNVGDGAVVEFLYTPVSVRASNAIFCWIPLENAGFCRRSFTTEECRIFKNFLTPEECCEYVYDPSSPPALDSGYFNFGWCMQVAGTMELQRSTSYN